jgi:hypothetical protein
VSPRRGAHVYEVRLDCGDGHCYQARVAWWRGGRPSRAWLLREARADAVAAFGRQARRWPLLDSRRLR